MVVQTVYDRRTASTVSDNDERRTPARGDDTFDNLFPADRGSRASDASHSAGRSSDETHALTPAAGPARAARPTQRGGEYDVNQIGSPPPPRRAGLVLPWVIITASVLAIAVVGFMLLRGQRTQPSVAATKPMTTALTTSASSPTSASSSSPSSATSSSSSSSSTSSSSSSSASTPPAAKVAPPGFEKCAGTKTGYKVKGSGTTCPFVADVAAQAAGQAADAQNGRFQLRVTSAATKKTYDVSCTVQAYIQCSLPGSQGAPTYIYVMRS